MVVDGVFDRDEIRIVFQEIVFGAITAEQTAACADARVDEFRADMGGDEIRIAAFGGVRLRAFRDGSADGAIDDRPAGFDFRAKPLQRLKTADGDDGTVDPILLHGQHKYLSCMVLSVVSMMICPDGESAVHESITSRKNAVFMNCIILYGYGLSTKRSLKTHVFV